MTKLDEIEAKTIPGIDAEGRRIVAMSVGAYDFLLRAVRQLGAIVRERESAAITRNRLEEHGIYDNLIDLDVLELLENDRS